MSFEVELKFQIENIEELEGRILKAGGRKAEDFVFEDNLLFDTEENRLMGKGSALRLRKRGERCWLTYKGPVLSDPEFKVREELEVRVEDFEKTRGILERIGFRVKFRYQKYTAKYIIGKVVLSLDRTPIGDFVELEGERDEVQKVRQLLELSGADPVRKDYIALAKEKGLTQMVF